MLERDRQTDRQTDGRTPGHSKDRAITISSRGKNGKYSRLLCVTVKNGVDCSLYGPDTGVNFFSFFVFAFPYTILALSTAWLVLVCVMVGPRSALLCLLKISYFLSKFESNLISLIIFIPKSVLNGLVPIFIFT